MKINRTIAGMTLALSLTALVGCGSSGSSKASDTTGASGSKTTASSGGSSGNASDKFVDVCKKITTDEVAAILGGAVTMEETPIDGCNFTQEDLRAASVAFNSSSSDTANGGYAGIRSGASSMIKGEVKDLDGVGDKAFVVAGTSRPGVGVVQVGPTLVQVTFLRSSEMSPEDVEAMTTKLLELAASKA